MHRDTVIGIVGVVILVAAMVGVFTFERSQADIDGDAAGDIASFTGATAEGTTDVGQSSDATIDVNQTGIVNLTFTLTWTPGDNSVDTLLLRVAPSQATQMTEGFESEAENDGEITLTVPVNNTDAAGTLGVGAWQVSVEFVDAQLGTPVQPPVPPPVGTDQTVSWTVAASGDAYAAAG